MVEETVTTINLHLGALKDKITVNKKAGTLFDSVMSTVVYTGPITQLLKSKIKTHAEKRVFDIYDLSGDMGNFKEVPAEANIRTSELKVIITLIDERCRRIESRQFYLI